MKQEVLDNIKQIVVEADSARQEKQTQRANELYGQAMTQLEQVPQEEFTNDDDWRQLAYCQIFFVGTFFPEKNDQIVNYIKQAIEILLNRVKQQIPEDWRKITYGYSYISSLTSDNNQEKINLIKQGTDSLNKIEEKTPEDWRNIANAHARICNISRDINEKIKHTKQAIDSLNKIGEKTPEDWRFIADGHFFISKLTNNNQEKIEHSKLGIQRFHEVKGFFSLIDKEETIYIIVSYQNLNELMRDEERIAYFEQMNNFYNDLIESSESKHFDPSAWRGLASLRYYMLTYLLKNDDIKQKKTCFVNLLETINKIPEKERIDNDLKTIADAQFSLADCYCDESDVEQAKKWFINSLGSFNRIMDKNERSYEIIRKCYAGLFNFEIESMAKTFYEFASTAFSDDQFTSGFEVELNKLFAAIIALPPNHILIRGLFCFLQLLPKDKELEKFPNSAIKTCLSDTKKRAWINGLTEEMGKINNSLLTLSNLVEGSNHFSTLVAFSIKDIQAHVKTLQGENEELKTQNQMLKEKLSFLEERMEKMEALLTSLLPSKEKENESEKQERSDDEPGQQKEKLKISLFGGSSSIRDTQKKHTQLLLKQ